MENKVYIMNKLVSIIIPVYNVEKYLLECLDSVIAQTYSNIEIFLINDGSTDNSGKICDEYAQKDSRVKVIHKENGGVSSARNVGLDLTQGEYITFIDSDDFVDKTYIEKMYDALEKSNADLVFCKYANYIDKKIEYPQESIPKQLTVNNEDKEFIDFISRFFALKKNIMGSACRVLYRKELINNYYFHLGIKISEDLLFLMQIIQNAKSINSIDEYLYFYRKVETSITQKYKKDYLQGQLNLYLALKNIFELFKSKNSRKIFEMYNALLCYYVFSNELKFKQINRKENICQIRGSELYKYFKLKNGLRIYGVKRKIKFLVVWFLIKFKLI